jgi:hypothetical protein
VCRTSEITHVLQYISFPLKNILQILYIHFHLNTILTRRTKGQDLEAFKDSNALSDTGGNFSKEYCHIENSAALVSSYYLLML